MPIDIGYYIQQIQLCTPATIKEPESKLSEKGKLLDEDRIDILIRGAMMTVKALEEEIYRSKTESYDYCSNEMNLFALATTLVSWSSWVFKSKSEDKNREIKSRDKATAVNEYIQSFIRNSIDAGQRIGEGGGIPERRRELIDV